MMMKIKSARKFPTVVDKRHESLYRAYHVLQLARMLLEENTPPSVITLIIDACYEDDLTALNETTWQEMLEAQKGSE